ncbi:hypothetical protein [Acidovorax kalamii]|uniref:hypothetical protein n=1 Tax=Acidovorax kalamii TaxID=2004485 RepID=UPI0020905584|nr:hypothetical protein [Acidovorax kalamii]MCO5354246.1 hypothetical protein [Acidovorax kalamii]
MSFTPPPAAPAADPPIPNRRTDAQEAFDLKTDAYLNWQTTFRTWLANFVAWCVTMLGELGIALSTVESNKNAAQSAAAAAEASAQNAAVIAGATKWAAGNYAQGVAVWSPISLLTYRRVPAGVTASATDPANDPAGWRLTGSPFSMPQKEITTALDAVTGLPHLLSVGVHYLIKHPLAECSMPSDAVAQEMVRVTNQSGASTPKLLKNGKTFNGYDDDLQLDILGWDKVFTMTAAGTWI